MKLTFAWTCVVAAAVLMLTASLFDVELQRGAIWADALIAALSLCALVEFARAGWRVWRAQRAWTTPAPPRGGLIGRGLR